MLQFSCPADSAGCPLYLRIPPRHASDARVWLSILSSGFLFLEERFIMNLVSGSALSLSQASIGSTGRLNFHCVFSLVFLPFLELLCPGFCRDLVYAQQGRGTQAKADWTRGLSTEFSFLPPTLRSLTQGQWPASFALISLVKTLFVSWGNISLNKMFQLLRGPSLLRSHLCLSGSIFDGGEHCFYFVFVVWL